MANTFFGYDGRDLNKPENAKLRARVFAQLERQRDRELSMLMMNAERLAYRALGLTSYPGDATFQRMVDEVDRGTRKPDPVANKEFDRLMDKLRAAGWDFDVTGHRLPTAHPTERTTR